MCMYGWYKLISFLCFFIGYYALNECFKMINIVRSRILMCWQTMSIVLILLHLEFYLSILEDSFEELKIA